jgi:hypothetical protein
MDFGSIAMSSGGKEFEKYARDCALLANRVEKQEHRETLLEMAREWMQAAMEEDEERQVASPVPLARLGHGRRLKPRPER